MEKTTEGQDYIEWSFIADKIQDEKCVLIVGPELIYGHLGSTIYEHLENTLSPGFVYINEDEFFSFRRDRDKALTYHRIRKFFKNIKEPPEVYRLIAKLPIHLIISLSPDLQLQKAFEEINRPHRFSYYMKQQNMGELNYMPTRDEPLIYNLLGSCDDQDSMVFSYEDLFEYIEAILGNTKLPTELQAILQDTKSYLFVGVKFEKWYLKLLMRILKIQVSELNYANGKSNILTARINDFYEQYFNLNFVEMPPLKFLEELKDCSKQITWKKPVNIHDVKLLIKEKVERAELNDAILILQDCLENHQKYFTSKHKTILTLISQDLHVIDEEFLKGTATAEQINVRKNKLTERILKFINTL